jgi:ketosteroid isomerase-like protein
MTTQTTLTTQQVVARFKELALEEKWFEIQDELFADDVKSIEPLHSRYMPTVEGKAVVRKKAEDFVNKIETVHGVRTSAILATGNHITVARDMDLTVAEFGRIQINEIMLYEVKDGQIVSEQFFY